MRHTRPNKSPASATDEAFNTVLKAIPIRGSASGFAARLLPLAACLLAATRIYAGEFDVEGTVNYQSLRSNYSPPPRKFRISVLDCQWRIHLEDSVPSSNQALKFTEIASDGVDVYQLDYPRNPTNVIFATIVPGPVPLADGKLASILWLAFCSKCYLKEAGHGTVRPVWLVDERQFESGAYNVQADWTNFAQSPFLLKNVVFYSDGLDYPFHGRPEQPTPLSPPYNEGYTQAVYSVAQTMNDGNLLLAKDFSLTLYGPKPGGRSTSDLLPEAKWFGHVDKAAEKTSVRVMVPEIAEKVFVQDARFVNVLTNLKTMNYIITNGWLRADDPKLVQGVANARNVRPAAPPMGKRQKIYLAFFILSALLGAVIVIIYKNVIRS
jgi:hypothetical protein